MTEEKPPVDELMDRLFACRDDTERAVAKVEIQGHFFEGMINSLDRSGANMISIGFRVSKSISMGWRGRRFESQVEQATENMFLVSDGNSEILRIAFVPAGADRCPMNGHLYDPSDHYEED
jgi:hypothetical protein